MSRRNELDCGATFKSESGILRSIKAMQTITLTIDEALLSKLDRVSRELSLSRTAFIQQALEAALRQQETLALERKHAEGYARHPVELGEFDDWENEQVWGQP